MNGNDLRVDVPIIGQPATVKAWAAHVVIRCNCKDQEPVLIPVGGIGECPACHRRFVVQQLHSESGRTTINVGLVVNQAPAGAPQGVPSPH